MGLWNDFKNMAGDALATAQTKVAQFNNAPFANATMAVCALVAAADGTIQDEELEDTIGIIENNSMLESFDIASLVKTFRANCKLATDKYKRLELMGAVKIIKKHPEQADMAMQIALMIANADGVFQDCEKKVVIEICHVLGLEPNEYGC